MPDIEFISDGRDESDDAALSGIKAGIKLRNARQEEAEIEAEEQAEEEAPEEDDTEKENEEELEERHFGPGAHPGTGTDQDVHAGDGTGGRDTGRTLHGGRIIEMTLAEQATAGELWKEGPAGENTWGFPRGRIPIEDPENPGQFVWLEGRDAIIEYTERQIMGEAIENGTFVAEDGTFMISMKGTADAISFSQFERSLVQRILDSEVMLQRAVEQGEKVTFLHNHPGVRSMEGHDISIPLSTSDVQTAIRMQFSEIRAVNTNGDVSILKISDPERALAARNDIVISFSELVDQELRDAGYYHQRGRLGFAGPSLEERLPIARDVHTAYEIGTNNALNRLAAEYPDLLEYIEEKYD